MMLEKKYRLLKELPGCEKDSIFHLFDFKDKASGYIRLQADYPYFPKVIVENNPEWFEEVIEKEKTAEEVIEDHVQDYYMKDKCIITGGGIVAKLKENGFLIVKASDHQKLLDSCVMCRECGIVILGSNYISQDHKCDPANKVNFLANLESYLKAESSIIVKETAVKELADGFTKKYVIQLSGNLKTIVG